MPGKTKHFQNTLHLSSINTSTPSPTATSEIVPLPFLLQNVSQKETNDFLEFTTILTRLHSSSVLFLMTELNLKSTAHQSLRSLEKLSQYILICRIILEFVNHSGVNLLLQR